VAIDNPLGEHNAVRHTDVIRELFIPAVEGFADMGNSATYGRYSLVVGGAASDAPWVMFTIRVPDDFVSFLSVKALWGSPAVSGNMYWRIIADYNAPGESPAAHSDTPAKAATATAGANLFNLQEPANPLTLSDLVKGDFLGLEFMRYGADALDTLNDSAYLYGLLFTYIAEQ